MNHKALTIDGHQGQVAGFTELLHTGTTIMPCITNITTNNLETSPHARGTIYEGNLLLSIMIEQTIIQAAIPSTETFNSTKSKYEAWMESIENAAQISGQNAVCISFSK